MAKSASHNFRLAAVCAALSLFCGTAQAASAGLQRMADEAALAAVQVLAASGSQDETARRAEAVVAARQIVGPINGVSAEIDASVATMVVTVKLSTPKAKSAAVGTARYVAPEQPAAWNWASRQHFALRPTPVVVGSTCPQGCDPVR